MFYTDEPTRDWERYCMWCEDQPRYNEDDLWSVKYDIEQLEQEIEYVEEHEEEFDTKKEQQEELNKMNEKLIELYKQQEEIEFYMCDE